MSTPNGMALCEYADCEKVLPMSEMEAVAPGVYVCDECSNKMEDPTGYCSLDCKLGYGCDMSC